VVELAALEDQAGEAFGKHYLIHVQSARGLWQLPRLLENGCFYLPIIRIVKEPGTGVPCGPRPARRADAKVLVKLMQSATGENPRMWGPSIIGFGTYHYRYESGREGYVPLAGFSPRKAATVCAYTLNTPGAGPAVSRWRFETCATGKSCGFSD
jgi:hypothetical protein